MCPSDKFANIEIKTNRCQYDCSVNNGLFHLSIPSLTSLSQALTNSNTHTSTYTHAEILSLSLSLPPSLSLSLTHARRNFFPQSRKVSRNKLRLMFYK